MLNLHCHRCNAFIKVLDVDDIKGYLENRVQTLCGVCQSTDVEMRKGLTELYDVEFQKMQEWRGKLQRGLEEALLNLNDKQQRVIYGKLKSKFENAG